MKLTVTGIGETRRYLLRVKNKMPEQVQELVKRLSERGVEVAKMYYSNAPYAGVNDVEVTMVMEGRYTATITAGGTATMFIEFGAGLPSKGMTEAPEAKEDLKNSEGLVARGKYGLRYGGKKYGWYYSGSMGIVTPEGTWQSKGSKHLIHTYGQPATPAMYWTKKDLESMILAVAKEIFND